MFRALRTYELYSIKCTLQVELDQTPQQLLQMVPYHNYLIVYPCQYTQLSLVPMISYIVPSVVLTCLASIYSFEWSYTYELSSFFLSINYTRTYQRTYQESNFRPPKRDESAPTLYWFVNYIQLIIKYINSNVHYDRIFRFLVGLLTVFQLKQLYQQTSIWEMVKKTKQYTLFCFLYTVVYLYHQH